MNFLILIILVLVLIIVYKTHKIVDTILIENYHAFKDISRKLK